MDNLKRFRRIFGWLLIWFGLFLLFYVFWSNLSDLSQVVKELSDIGIAVFVMFYGAFMLSRANKQE